MAVLPMRISMKKSGYDLFGEILPGSPALPRFLDADGHNSGFVMLQIVEPQKDSSEPLQRGVVLFQGEKLKKVMRVNEKKFQGKGFYFKSLLIDEKNGKRIVWLVKCKCHGYFWITRKNKLPEICGNNRMMRGDRPNNYIDRAVYLTDEDYLLQLQKFVDGLEQKTVDFLTRNGYIGKV